MTGKLISFVLLSALLIGLARMQDTPAPYKSESVVTTQPTESVKQPPSNSEQITKPVVPEIKAVEQTKPQEQQQSQAKPVAQTTPVPADDQEQLLAAAGVPSHEWEAAKSLIYKESTWRPAIVNSSGCIGLGQNCPDANGRYWLVDACPNWQSDPVCQIKRFSHYATERYGSWQAALSFWQSRVPINGRDVGHWW